MVSNDFGVAVAGVNHRPFAEILLIHIGGAQRIGREIVVEQQGGRGGAGTW